MSPGWQEDDNDAEEIDIEEAEAGEAEGEEQAATQELQSCAASNYRAENSPFSPSFAVPPGLPGEAPRLTPVRQEMRDDSLLTPLL